MKFADSRANLVVGVGGQVLHQEVEQARIPLHNAQNLQSAVGGFHRWDSRGSCRRCCFGRCHRDPTAAREAQRAERGLGKLALEEDIEKATKRQKDTIQLVGLQKDIG